MGKRKDSRVPSAAQAAALMTRRVHDDNAQYFASYGERYRPDMQPWGEPVWAEFCRWLQATGGRPYCRHIWRTDMLTWSMVTKALLCARCMLSPMMAMSGTAEDWTCDLCRQLRPVQEQGFEATFLTTPAHTMPDGRIWPPVQITFGTCLGCRTSAGLAKALHGIFAGVLA